MLGFFNDADKVEQDHVCGDENRPDDEKPRKSMSTGLRVLIPTRAIHYQLENDNSMTIVKESFYWTYLINDIMTFFKHLGLVVTKRNIHFPFIFEARYETLVKQ